ncbi:hypothetical protein SEUCBS140593_001026 [Sporothrix eucalyptigena]|uniref:U1-type domain-containing protein n=1 Tax=Sporothrix eucalyptigena TaxID=1812306 RepID=A0ABP0AV66_9PEZI
MADYWKSTPKYWCKHCQVYVPDTKLQRANHEATGKHQSAVRRALRNLHRDHERQEREKDEAKREVARLNALVDGKSAAGSSSSSAPPRSRPPPQTAPTAPSAPREQLEQLAELGVSIPDAFRPDLAMAGDWTVTETRVVEVQEGDEDAKKGTATRSFGVRKRPRGDNDDDDDVEQQKGGHSEFEKIDLDSAVQGLFKRPRQWGRDSRTGGSGLDDAGGDLDSLLSSAVAKPKEAKKEEAEDTKYTKEEPKDDIKKEGSAATDDSTAASIPPPTKIKEEVDTDALPVGLAEEKGEKAASSEPAVLFKKRKAKPGRGK